MAEDIKIEELLTRGVEEVINKEDLEKKLHGGKKLRIKLGIDPTSPNIHIGRSIPLLKLQDFQKLGHKIILIIGDFTGVIGDTSDKESERPMLTKEEVTKNLENYIDQAKKLIDIDQCEVRYNSEWLGELDYYEIAKQADTFSLNEFISRENISKRLDQGKRISLRELLYPMMQGYDSVAVQADVEIGGTDQKFNLLAGRELQRQYNQEPQNILMNPLIEGLDGRKMSSSWGNTINLLDSPDEMFGKVMSLRDELVLRYFMLATRVPKSEIEEIHNNKNPKDIKIKLAKELVKMYHSEKDAEDAENNWNNIFSKGEFPEDALLIEAENGAKLGDILVEKGKVESKSEWRRLVEAGAVSYFDGDILGEKINDPNEVVKAGESKLKIGKKIFLRIKS